jgi:hypothetical protein
MPSLTFYAYKGAKHNRVAIHQLNHFPTDWQDLKDHLLTCALKLWHEHKIDTEILLTLEQHLGGKYVEKTRRGGFRPIKVHWQRGLEWTGRLTFNSKTQEITVDNCRFGQNLISLATDYYAERGIKYRAPSVIPKMHQNLTDTKSLLMEPSAARYADYSRRQHSPYDRSSEKEKKKRSVYGSSRVERKYLPKSLRAE